jgi:glucans biosynthesis protein
VAFLGASYFRAIGELHQYGLSARGVAIDTAVADRNEEFPDFTRIFIGPQSGDTVTVYALLEGPKIVGAVKFLMRRGEGVVMDIEQSYFLRGDIVRFGIAPLTSMFWFSETAKANAVDWRPEVHDSDGLAMWTGWGGRLWRPLNNPPHIMASAFSDNAPNGFGLLQRDRVFDHYLDGVNYERRPSLWVEPLGNWGKGAIHLVELATDDEIHDNIVVMWVPETPATAGSEFSYSYRLHWLADEPFPSPLARVVATRLGNGGQPGQPRPKNVRKFMVEFLGGPLNDLAFGNKPELEVEASRGKFTDYRMIEPVPDGVAGHWRVTFDLAEVEGKDPVELRATLKQGDKILSETWMFQYHPF